MTIQELAKVANGYLVRDRERDVVILKDAPEWMQDVCREVHSSGSMLPDDWRYEFIQDALNALEDDVDATPDVDSLYPYTADRLGWLSSRVDRMSYCDEMVEDMGWTFTSTADLIALGMVAELTEVFNKVRNALEVQCEQMETADE